MYDFLIVGSGLFGAVCAYELKKLGYRILVIEKRNHVGGNIFTESISGIMVHKYGPHIFHTSNKKIWDYFASFCSFNNFINTPVAIYKNELYNLPFNMNTFTKLWNDVFTPEQAIQRIEKEKENLSFGVPQNLEEQAISLVGTTIYEKLIKGYTSKQWGMECNKLPPFIIKRLPVRFTFNNNYFDDLYQGIPIGGYTQIIDKMLNGVDVRLNCDFLQNKEELMNEAKTIIYTGQIDSFFEYKYGHLEYRSLSFVNEELNVSNYQGNAVINYTDFEIPFTRIIEHKHFEGDLSFPKTIITKEYPKKWTHGCEPFYPINDEKNNTIYKKYYNESLKIKNVYFGGRLGTYKYFDMDDTIEAALNLVSMIKKGR